MGPPVRAGSDPPALDSHFPTPRASPPRRPNSPTAAGESRREGSGAKRRTRLGLPSGARPPHSKDETRRPSRGPGAGELAGGLFRDTSTGRGHHPRPSVAKVSGPG